MCIASYKANMCREYGGNDDGLCAEHTFGESVVEMLLILCALHTFYGWVLSTLYGNSVLNILGIFWVCSIAPFAGGGVLGTLALRVQRTLNLLLDCLIGLADTHD